MKDINKKIKNSILFSTLNESLLIQLLKEHTLLINKYDTNNIIHLEGDHCEYLEIILEGTVIIERIDIDGNLLTITEFNENDVLGGNLLFSKNPFYPMTVTAKNKCLTLSVHKNTLLELLQNQPTFLRTYLELISDNALVLGEKIKHYINRPLRERIINYLNYESNRQQSKNIVLPISKKTLAEKLGVQRTSLSRELSKMKNDHLINFSKSQINILY